jgi:hypothetical protein
MTVIEQQATMLGNALPAPLRLFIADRYDAEIHFVDNELRRPRNTGPERAQALDHSIGPRPSRSAARLDRRGKAGEEGCLIPLGSTREMGLYLAVL